MSGINHISGRQIAAARVLTGMGQEELAKRANLSAPTLRRIEAAKEKAIAGTASPNNLAAIRAALESAGIVFLADGDVATGPGVSLRGE